ncbi:MAG TPA: amino acid adenylation domain-containing protein [Kofleriaceae bacterium]|jgi:amino acid adenylation domain-containing protein
MFQPAHRWFEEQVDRTPDAPAVVFDGQMFTYHELETRSNRLAHRLLRVTSARDTCVGVVLRRGIDHLVALLSLHKAGLTLVPVSSVSLNEPQERMAHIVENARVRLILTHRDLGNSWPHIEHVLFEDQADVPVSRPSVSVNPDDLAYVIHTSGSTGRPKGCAIAHRGLANLVAWQLDYSRGTSEQRTLQFNGLSFDLCFQEIFPTWAVGGCLVVMPESARREPGVLLDLVSRERVSRLILPFVVLRQLADAAELTDRTLPDLREVYVGGEALQLTPAIRTLFRRNPEAALINVYGPTEAHIVTAYKVPGAPDDWPAVAPIGTPIRGTRIYIVNQAGQKVPPGLPGEVMIGGDAIARGYLHNPRETAERFVPDRFANEPGARVYRTGDLARRLPSGVLEFVGRIDHQLKIRGYRVEPGEVEAALVAHPGVRQVAVQGRNDTGEMRLVAYLVLRGAPLSPGELRAFLAPRLPDELIPSAFVVMSELPLTPDGKVNLKALPAPQAAAPREPETDGASRVENMDALERLIADVWQEVLEIQHVAADDNFFELGGQSMLAFRVITRLNELLSLRLPVMDVFRFPTVSELAVSVRELQAQVGSMEKPPLLRDPGLPAETEASPSQAMLYRMNTEAPNLPAENQDLSMRIVGTLDVAALERALGEITRRHDVLRSRFRRVGTPADGEAEVGKSAERRTRSSAEGDAEVGSKLMHSVVPWEPLRLSITEVSGGTDEERWAAAGQIHQRRWSSSFDLGAGTMKLELVRVSPRDHLLIAIFHHIIFDGMSYPVFFRELSALYRAFSRGEPSPLEELPFRFADHVAWQRKLSELPIGQSQLAYWRKRFEGVGPMRIRGDKPRDLIDEKRARKGPPDVFPGRAVKVQLSPDVVASVRKQAVDLQVTVYTVLVAAYFVLVREYSEQAEVIMMTSVSGRDRPGAEQVLGQFNASFPLRVSLPDHRLIRDVIFAVRDDAVAQRTNCDLPASYLLDEYKQGARVIFNFLDLREAPLPELPGAEVSLATRPSDPADVIMNDLAVFMADGEAAITAEVVCNADLFTDEGLRRVATDYLDLIAWLTRNADRTVQDARARSSRP